MVAGLGIIFALVEGYCTLKPGYSAQNDAFELAGDCDDLPELDTSHMTGAAAHFLWILSKTHHGPEMKHARWFHRNLMSSSKGSHLTSIKNCSCIIGKSKVGAKAFSLSSTSGITSGTAIGRFKSVSGVDTGRSSGQIL